MPAVSIAEGGAAEEFAEQRRRGNLVGGDRLEIAQETHQPVGLGILLHVAGDVAQDRLSILLHHPQLEYE